MLDKTNIKSLKGFKTLLPHAIRKICLKVMAEENFESISIETVSYENYPNHCLRIIFFEHSKEREDGRAISDIVEFDCKDFGCERLYEKFNP